jgi:ribosomal-protein-alanine N-acetyltransferase
VDVLQTEHLILRPLAASDANDLFAARCDSAVMEFWDGPPDSARSETIAVVDLFLADVLSGTAKYWTIRRREDESFVGVCDVSEVRIGESADIGFMLVREFWGVGFGGEVVRISRLEAGYRADSWRECPVKKAIVTGGIPPRHGHLQS